jgi:hypothetical protein
MSHPALPAADLSFATALAESARGPERDGVFALWLVVRAALGGAPPVGATARHPERLRAVQLRLRSLNPPAPLRRSLAAAITALGSNRDSGAVALHQLVAPAAECVGRGVADAVLAASSAARTGPG